MLVLPASEAVRPNRSMRYFAPQGNPADLGWPVPYWYAEEVVSWSPEGA